MPHTEEQPVYQTEEISNDLFSGNLSIEQALQRLRTRLLDLSTRNRLLSFRHPKGRSLQFVDQPNLNLVFTRLLDGKDILLKWIPDPPPLLYTNKRPDPKSHAESLGVDVETRFSPESCRSSANKHTPRLQALYYPADLDKMCRKIRSEARTIIEETGTNMLYLVFGFLEFYERDDVEKPALSPLIAVPVTLERVKIDPDTRTYIYALSYSGEDVHENQTLREKLSQDFALQLPELEEDDEPGDYFKKIEKAIENLISANLPLSATTPQGDDQCKQSQRSGEAA
ncbi:hypothetical protein GMST_40070 [Geomonas silvestris]|uniref:DUF4011 domain-containing protein n=1 Tax=Geomonas silvestris TaxID=2740184 RepID=A0A6V8MP46_9BACT|nr:hypothetical protein GMST_40070 [Geomonas silvestris]